MNDNVQNVIVKVNVNTLENLTKRLEIIADHLDTENHQPMVGTIYEAAEFFKDIIDSINFT